MYNACSRNVSSPLHPICTPVPRMGYQDEVNEVESDEALHRIIGHPTRMSKSPISWVLQLNSKELETSSEISFVKHSFTEFSWLFLIIRDTHFRLYDCRQFPIPNGQHTRCSVPSAVESWGLHTTFSYGILNRNFINHNRNRDKGLRSQLICTVQLKKTRLKEVKWPGQGYKSEANLEFLIIFSIWYIEITKIIAP